MDSLFARLTSPEAGIAARDLVDAVAGVMDVRALRVIEPDSLKGMGIATRSPALLLQGRLLVDPDRAHSQITSRYEPLGYVPLLREVEGEQTIVAVRGSLPTSAGRPWVAVVLFCLTLLSVLWIGSAYEEASGGAGGLLSGVPFAASLLGILLAHEMGHFAVAKWQRIPASLPYFIPMPLSLIGTMGAVIQTTAPPRNRRALLLLGAAGPLAGMVVALPVLFLGLSQSNIGVVMGGSGSFQEGNSLLYAALKLLIFGRFLPSNGEDVFINSVALAGWAGLLVTALNLIPAGQLDGGHIAYAVLGSKARYLMWVVFAALLAMTPLWEGWLLWAGLVLLLGRVHSVPLDDLTRLRPKERALAIAALVVFILVFIPIPLAFQ